MREIDNILLKMAEDLNQDQLQRLKIILSSELLYSDPTATEVSVNLDDNDDVMRRFAFDLKINQRSDRTIGLYLYNVRKFFGIVNKNFREVLADDLQYYIAYRMMNDKVSIATLNNERKAIRIFFDWLVDNEYLIKSNVRKMKDLKEPAKEKIILTDQEIEVIRDACITPREIALIDFMLSTGLRVSELRILRTSDVDFAAGEVNVYAPKTRSFRKVFLDAKSTKHLKDYLENRKTESQYLFIPEKRYVGKSCSRDAIENAIKRIVSRTPITKKVTVHTFRKTLASRLHKKGMSAENISKILGHSTPTTTMTYYILVDNDNLKQQFNKAIL